MAVPESFTTLDLTGKFAMVRNTLNFLSLYINEKHP
jgi:hypothetical protein